MPVLFMKHFSLNETPLRLEYKRGHQTCHSASCSSLLADLPEVLPLSGTVVQHNSESHFRVASTKPKLDQNPKQTPEQSTAATSWKAFTQFKMLNTPKGVALSCCSQRRLPFCTLDTEWETCLTRPKPAWRGITADLRPGITSCRTGAEITLCPSLHSLPQFLWDLNACRVTSKPPCLKSFNTAPSCLVSLEKSLPSAGRSTKPWLRDSGDLWATRPTSVISLFRLRCSPALTNQNVTTSALVLCYHSSGLAQS